MDIEARLTQLESRYRRALSATVAAKAHYFCLATQPGATRAAIDQGWRTGDIFNPADPSARRVGTKEMGAAIVAALG